MNVNNHYTLLFFNSYINANIILIFVKIPEKDHVKKRLTQSIGDEKALKVYQRLLEMTKEIFSAVTCARHVMYSEILEEHDMWESGLY